MACKSLLLLLVAGLAVAVADDLSSLQPLTDCVKANSAGKGFIMGWGVTDGGTGSSNSVTASIAATNAALAAAGVPGITDANTGSGGVSGLSNNPCGDPVPWTGIQCENGRITQVLMSEFGPGSLPCDVGSFGSLSGLDKVQNVDFTAVGLTGSLPDSWSSGFGSLQKLVLSQNKIGGSLPASWSGGFKSANTIDLDQNVIGGSLPDSYGNSSGNLPQLINLVLGNNKLTGSLPAWNGGFKKLQLLGLSTNQLSGGLPSGWSFPVLSTLELYSNGFTGCLPSSWPGQLQNLTTLRVQNNKLSGNIPGTYDNWNSLTTITISPGNSFCGTISSQLATKPPNGQGQRMGNRFDPEPASKNGNGGYDLGSCSGHSCSSSDSTSTKASLEGSGPAPAPGPSEGMAPNSAPVAAAAPVR